MVSGIALSVSQARQEDKDNPKEGSLAWYWKRDEDKRLAPARAQEGAEAWKLATQHGWTGEVRGRKRRCRCGKWQCHQAVFYDKHGRWDTEIHVPTYAEMDETAKRERSINLRISLALGVAGWVCLLTALLVVKSGGGATGLKVATGVLWCFALGALLSS